MQRHAFRNQSGTQQVGKTDGGGTGAEEQIFLVLELRALDLGRVDHAGQRDARRALHVVVIDAVFVAVALQQMDRVAARPVLEVDAALREHLLHGFDELVHERIEVLGRRTRLAQAQVQRIVQVLLVVGARHRGTSAAGIAAARRRCGIELQLADRDAHAVGAEVAQAEDAAAVGDADEPHVLLRPVPQHLLHVAAARDRKVHAAGWR